MEMKSEIKNLGLHAEDIQGFDVFQAEKEEIWFGPSSNHHHGGGGDGGGDDLLDDPSSLFYADDFPPLPDFPCMSSSSSSSSTHRPAAETAAVVKAPAASSSASTASSSSWAVLKSDADHDPSSSSMDFLMPAAAEDDMDLMENFGSCIDLLETSDICWDPSPLFEDEADPTRLLGPIPEDREAVHPGEGGGGAVIEVELGGAKKTTEAEEGDLAVVFFEWLKSNKEMISAEDLRNIKIKKSTIEAAAKRLGGGKEGMKQLLKLILQWVQNHHLQNKKKESPAVSLTNSTAPPPPTMLVEDNLNDKNSNSNTNNNTNNFSGCPPPPPPAWMAGPPPPAPFVSEPTALGFSPMMGYMGPPPDPYSNEYHLNHHHMVDTTTTTPLTWGPPAAMQFGLGPHYNPYSSDPSHAGHGFGGYGNPNPYPAVSPGYYYHPGLGDGLMRLGASATKEARKKRMARQRRFLSHNHRNNHHHNQQQQQQQQHQHNLNQHHHQQNNQTVEQHPGLGNPGGVAAPPPNWVYWPAQVNQMQMQVQVQMPPPSTAPPAPPPGNGVQRQVGVDKKQQGWKTEKNLRFLLQKVLKQSDVGNLGRIVLPKKEAEMHLPELEARDGIPIAMEDIGTSRIWNMRYRFWPNNKSRMYLLENTGDFVRSNGLQEGDFIVIYSDVKCGKYMIRGVKVRQQQQQQEGGKPETPNKKPGKIQKTQGPSSPAGPSSSPSRRLTEERKTAEKHEIPILPLHS